MDSNGVEKIEGTVLDIFRNLSKDKEKIRVRAGISLLKYLTNNKNEEERKYAISRIIRGLGGQNVNSKIGYYSSLVAILNSLDVTLTEVFEHLDKHLHKSGANTKSENADIYNGHILVCGAVIRSNLFTRSTPEEKEKLLDYLLNAGKSRDYLLPLAYNFFIDAVEQCPKDTSSKIKSELSKPLNEYNLDSLYLALKISEKVPKVIKKTFGKSGICSADNLPEIVTVLTNVNRITAINHPVYELIVNKYEPVELLEKIDGTLIKHNRNKLLITMNLTRMAVEKFNAVHLGHNLITQILNSYRREKDDQFITISSELFESISRARLDDDVKISIVKKLLFDPGTITFEKITKSKVVQQLTTSLGAEGIVKLGEVYRKVIISKKYLNADRLYIAHLFSKLVNHKSARPEWRIEQLGFLMRLGLVESEIGADLAAALKSTFFKTLELKFAKLDESSVILRRLFVDLNGSKLRRQLPYEAVELQDKIEEITKVKSTDKVFKILLLHMGLQLHNDPKLASDALVELLACYERIGTRMAEEPEWIEVIVELFLSLLSHNSHLIRSVIKTVFPHLSDSMNDSATRQILSVLDPDRNPLDAIVSESEGSDSDEESESESEEEEKVSDQLKLELHRALADNGEDIDIDELNEEDGLKLDETLSELFKKFGPNKGKRKKQTRDDETLTHFRVRVLDLIEILIESAPAQTFEIMLALLRCLEYSVRDEHQKPLRDRVRACLKKLTNLKSVRGEADYSSLLENLLDSSGRNAVMARHIGNEISDCCTFLVKISNDRLVDPMMKAVREYFEKRECSVPFQLFRQVLQLNWAGNSELAEYLVEAAFRSEVRPFRRSQALELLKVFYSNHRLLANVETGSISLKFLNNSVDFFRSTDKFKEHYVSLLFNLLVSIKYEEFDWTELVRAAEEWRERNELNGVSKKAFNKFIRSIDDGPKKRKSDEETQTRKKSRL